MVLLGDLVNNHEDLDEAAYRILRERTGMDDVYLEQVKAFGESAATPPPGSLPSPIAP
jgi:8-oxo-dGTP diphosphatase